MTNSASSGLKKKKKNCKHFLSILSLLSNFSQYQFAILMRISEAEDRGLFYVDFVLGKRSRFCTFSRHRDSHGPSY